MPKTYAVTVIKRIAYVEVFMVDAETQDDANDMGIEAAKNAVSLMETYCQQAKSTHEVGSVVHITV